MIYAIQAENSERIKFGYSRNVQERLKTLQTANSEKLSLIVEVDWPKSLEKGIHEFLSKHKTRGEWFEKTSLVLNVVEDMKNGDSSSLTSMHHNDKPDNGNTRRCRKWRDKNKPRLNEYMRQYRKKK